MNASNVEFACFQTQGVMRRMDTPIFFTADNNNRMGEDVMKNIIALPTQKKKSEMTIISGNHLLDYLSEARYKNGQLGGKRMGMRGKKQGGRWRGEMERSER